MSEHLPIHDVKVVPPAAAFSAQAHVKSMAEYRAQYERSVRDPEGFWAEKARRLAWIEPWDKVLEWEFTTPRIAWFLGGKLNVSHNCLDRHVQAGKGDRVAIIWEGDDPKEDRKVTYRELLRDVCRFANLLKKLGVQRGDRVCIYLPMIPELAAAMLACTRIGAVHSMVFAGFSAQSLADRIQDSQCSVLITADEGLRGGRKIALKQISDEAMAKAPSIRTCLVVRRTGAPVAMQAGRDLWFHDEVKKPDIRDECPPEAMDA